MSLFKQKISSYEFFYALFRKVIETPELFPTDETLLEQGDFTEIELRRINLEAKKLAIIYMRIYVLELCSERKISANKEACELGYGHAALAVFQDDSIDFDAVGIDSQDFMNTLDHYTTYIVQHSDDKKTDDYYKAFQYFQKAVFAKRKTTEIPLGAVTLAKYIREQVSKNLVNDLLSSYKVI